MLVVVAVPTATLATIEDQQLQPSVAASRIVTARKNWSRRALQAATAYTQQAREMVDMVDYSPAIPNPSHDKHKPKNSATKLGSSARNDNATPSIAAGPPSSSNGTTPSPSPPS
ncbi:hypothetical protein GOP47_0008674 [Adiantum capillus-veneris]|uniref:Uncharacterized protein n=1 Tax=Adiantum capillus-veneris TaxID=13818 RepID=A0A9D4UZ16_ADICA|nr:hypothetical protein GOP47_0008674 [Adiantum capillus-veneris]